MRIRINSLVPALVLVAANVAGAQAINGAPTGLASPATTLTFEGTVANAPAGNEYSGVTFSSNLYNDPTGYFSGVGGGSMDLANFQASQCPCTTPSDIYFSSAVNGAAFQFITNPGTSIFTAMLGATNVYSFSAVTDGTGANTPTWYGFDSSIAFDRINIQSGGGNNAFVLDNLQIGESAVVTPEPASLVLMATGLFGVAGFARRRRR